MMPPLQPQVFAIFRLMIEERTGIRYAAEDTMLVGDRLWTRATEAGFDSLLDYYYYLRYDPGSGAEWSALIDTLVVNETYFFREYAQLRVAVAEHVLPLVNAGRRPRIWCAACSTGEEPYTIAMLLADHGALSSVELIASDLSDRALSRARTQEFGLRSLRPGAPSKETERWLEVVDGRPRLRRDLRSAVDFRKLNLLDEAGVAELGEFDMIACRNVLIYFAEATIERVVHSLSKALKPDGLLLVGASESLLRFGAHLACEERQGAFFYRKTA